MVRLTSMTGVTLAWPSLATHDEDWHRALDVQATLWRSGRVRAVGFPDLLTAAVAERERVMLMHYASDHDLIAEVTSGSPPKGWDSTALRSRTCGGR
jgi:predicted nucleic acid-binding protein